MVKVICIKSCVDAYQNRPVYVGDIFFTSNITTFSRWITIYADDTYNKDFYLGAYESSNFCKLDDWRDSRMASILD